jgi:hypothetical protein
MREELKVCWISAGVSSFIAGYLERETIDKFVYIDIADQHEDSMRFIKDCEKFLGKEIEIIRCERYKNVNDVILGYGIIKNPYNQFAPCTNVLKKQVRKDWERKHSDFEITYVWGFDLNEKHRAERLDKSMPEFKHQYPLIERMLQKQDCHAICDRLGIKRPKMYDLGYSNNNCVGCIKGGMGYWNRIRIDFPEVFKQRSKMERIIGASCIKDVYLDELDPQRGRMEEEIMEDCGIMCYLNL